MFDKRLFKEFPQANSYIYRQVLSQWVGLFTNIVFTLMFVWVFVALINGELLVKHILMFLIAAFILLMIRALALKKVTQFSLKSSHFVKKDLRTKLFSKIFALGMHYQELVKTSELVQLAVEGIHQLETYYALYLPQLFYSLLAPLTLFITILFLDVTVAITLLICVPLIPVSIIIVQKIAKRLLSRYWGAYTELGDSFLENLQGITTLKIYQSDAYKHKAMNKEAETFRKVTMRVLMMQLNSIIIMDIVAYGGAALASYLSISHFLSNDISLYQALAILLLSFEFFIPLRQLGSFFHIAMNGVAASKKIMRVLDADIVEKGKVLKDDYTISINNLNFGYVSDRHILKNISMEVNVGEFIGIVGESGCGKSTLAKLMMGYHGNYNGELLVGNTQRNELNDEDFLNHFVYITHDAFIFKGSVKENLSMGKEYSDDELWNALKKVRLDEFFKTQGGLDFLLLESGSNLSGGQRQRLNLARVLLLDKDVYIFDEATSNIDVESEEMILEVIEELSKSKTVVMITHRLKNVENADIVLVMEDGQIKEQGTHKSLLKESVIYKDMLLKQKELEAYHE